MIGKKVGAYEIIEELGAGGMGYVFRGVDTRMGTPVAIKQLRTDLVNSDLMARFRREGALLRQLNHPNIVKMIDAVEDAGQHFLIMELVPGGSLRDTLDRQPQLPLERVMEIALDISDALTRAHRLDIIHRDLKPANVLIAEDGTSRLTDFGVARVGGSTLTETGAVIGTLAYISPEIFNGEEADRRTDIWAFGVMLFEMLAGQLPFQGEQFATLLNAILRQPIPDLENLRPDAPAGLVDLIYRMLAKNVLERIPSMRLVGAEIEAMKDNTSVGAIFNRTASAESGEPTYIGSSRFKSSQTGADTHLHNLPNQITPFIGRETEIAEINQLLADPGVRLLTVLGPGGMGKTSLSLQIAREQLGKFRDGVYFVPLAPLTSADFVISTIAEAISFSFYGETPPQEQLLNYLREKSLLLVMDNFEHVLEAAQLVDELLQQAPDIKIIATSRERLNLQQENVFRIEGLDLPDQDLDDARQSSAVKLFLQGAGRVQPGYEPEQNDLASIIKICRLTQGMPLGIVLASAWVTMLTPDEIVAEMVNSLDVLETDMRNVPERHRSIRAVFDYCWIRLSGEEQQLVANLTVFRGGFMREAAQQVANASLRTLMDLVNKSLLYRRPEGRFEIHGLLRQYAAERSQAAGETTIHTAHSAYYLGFIQQQEDHLLGRNQVIALQLVGAEIENIRAAWDWAVAQGLYDLLAQSWKALSLYHELHNFFQEGEACFALATDALKGQPQPLLVDLLNQQSLFAYQLARYAAARDLAEQGLALASSDQQRAESLLRLGFALFPLGENSAAIDHLQESLTLSKSLNNRERMARALLALEYTYTRAGQYETAIEVAEEALRLYKEIGNLAVMGECLVGLGTLHSLVGNYEQSKTFVEESLNVYQKIGSHGGRAYTLYMLGFLHFSMGAYDASEDSSRESLALFQKLGINWGKAWALLNLGSAASATGRLQEADAYLQESLAIHQNNSNQFAIAWVMALLGDTSRQREDFASAARHYSEAIQTAADAQAFPVLMLALKNIAELLKDQQNPARAVELLAQIIENKATWRFTKHQAQELLDQIQTELEADTFQDAYVHGQQVDLIELINDVKSDLDSA